MEHYEKLLDQAQETQQQVMKRSSSCPAQREA